MKSVLNLCWPVYFIFYQKIKQEFPPDIHKGDKTFHSEDGHNTIEDSLVEESLNLLNDTGVTESESEIKYRTDSEKDSFEEIHHKPSPVTATHTNLKRAYVWQMSSLINGISNDYNLKFLHAPYKWI